MTFLSDSFQRPINYLRISVTDRCNLRCIYCTPSEGIRLIPRSEILSYEEICLVAQAAAELGINKLRLTGGEPLVRDSLPELIQMLAKIENVNDLSLTTNGVLLGKFATTIKRAGLKRVNVSLDSLHPKRFQQIARRNRLEDTLLGIKAAQAAGLSPVKINMVVMRGINDDEILSFAGKTIEEGWHIRFIEFMPLRPGTGRQWFMSISEIKDRIESVGRLEPCLLDGNGPAKYFCLPKAKGTIGFIGPISEHTCFNCNRLRLTAEGKLRPCLLSDEEIDLRKPLRRGAPSDEIKRLIKQAVASKPKSHRLKYGIKLTKRVMAQIGG